jgi:diadenosine tetraphosphatase ApaH/serine/threonine PP2A family protein phosphatase
MRTFVIGDVHGCYLELRNLVAELDPKVGDRFAFVGDIVDKGLQTVMALRYVKLLLSLYPGSVAAAGNHESKAIERYRRDKQHPKGEDWWKEATEKDWEFIHSMPLYARFPELNLLVVHGGLFPRFFKLYPQGLDDKVLLVGPWYRGGNKYRKRAKRFLYTRYINPETGDVVALGDETDETPHWSDLYDGREGFVIYGHEPQMTFSPRVSKHAIGVDTAVVAGGLLTAAVLSQGKPVDYVYVCATEATEDAYQKKLNSYILDSAELREKAEGSGDYLDTIE